MRDISARELKGHNILAVERFWDNTRWIFRLTGISRQTINSAIRKLEKSELVYLEQREGRNTMVCLTEKGKDFSTEKILPLFQIEDKIWGAWTVNEQEKYIQFSQTYRDLLKKYLREDL